MDVMTNKQRLGRMIEMVGKGLPPYVEGALESGDRAAAEVHAALG